MLLWRNAGKRSSNHSRCGKTKSVNIIRVFICSLRYQAMRMYLLTPRCRVLLEKLTGLQLVKKFPAFHGTRRFITALTSVRHLSLSWASPFQSIYPYPTSWRSILILSTHLRLGLPSGLVPSGFPIKTLYTSPLLVFKYLKFTYSTQGDKPSFTPCNHLNVTALINVKKLGVYGQHIGKVSVNRRRSRPYK